MKVTICSFEPWVKHLPIVHVGEHIDMVRYLENTYDFHLPEGYVLEVNHPLDYMADLRIGKEQLLARLNTVSLKGAEQIVRLVNRGPMEPILSGKGEFEYYIDDSYGDGKDYDTPNTIHFEGDGEYPYGPNGRY